MSKYFNGNISIYGLAYRLNIQPKQMSDILIRLGYSHATDEDLIVDMQMLNDLKILFENLGHQENLKSINYTIEHINYSILYDDIFKQCMDFSQIGAIKPNKVEFVDPSKRFQQTNIFISSYSDLPNADDERVGGVGYICPICSKEIVLPSDYIIKDWKYIEHVQINGLNKYFVFIEEEQNLVGQPHIDWRCPNCKLIVRGYLNYYRDGYYNHWKHYVEIKSLIEITY